MNNTIKYSLDGKTIQTAESMKELGTILRGEGGVVTCTFTTFDLINGHTLQLFKKKKTKSQKFIYVGKSLTEADLKAKYDDFGKKIEPQP